jgi:hypothetical protein
MRRVHRMKKAIVLVVVALAIPTSVAFAKASPTRGKSNPIVMYVVKGTFTNYQVGTSISIFNITHSNYHARALKNAGTLNFPLTSTTRVTNANGAATTIADGDVGIIKFKAPLRASQGNNLVTTLQSTAKVKHIIDQSQH